MNILTTGMGWIGHTPGGLNRYFADYTAAMVRHGHRVKAYVAAGGDRSAIPEYMGEALAAPGGAGTWTRMKAFRQAVGGAARAGRPDVFNPHFALYASLIGKGQLPANTPIVTHFHGPWARESMVEDGAGPLIRKLRYRMKKAVENAAYRRSDRFIVLSRYFRDILEREYGVPGDRIHRIPGAVDETVFRPSEDRTALRQELGIPAGSRVLFCVRRLVRRMGIDRLIRAMPEVVRSVPDAMLLIAGDGAQRSELERLAAELELNGKAKFLGRVSNEELVQWYQAADFSVVPTVTLEGFGLVTVESLACGTPVLGTAGGGTKEILARFSPDQLFRDDSPEAMAEGIVRALLGAVPVPDREACRRYVLRNYTWREAARSVTELFERAVRDKRRRADA